MAINMNASLFISIDGCLDILPRLQTVEPPFKAYGSKKLILIEFEFFRQFFDSLRVA